MKKHNSISFKPIYLVLLLLVAFVVIKSSSIIVLAEGAGTKESPYTEKSELINQLVINVRAMLKNHAATSTPVYYNPSTPYVDDNELTMDDEQLNTVYDSAMAYTIGVSAANESDYIRENLGLHGKGISTQYKGYYDGEAIPENFVAIDAVYEVTYSADYLTNSDEESQVYSTLNTAVTGLNLSGSEYDKAKAIYDYVRLNVTYDYSALVIPEGETEEQKAERLKKHSTYAAAVNRKSVCQGYASMLYYMMRKAGLECRIVTGTATGSGNSTAEAHAWNIVRIDGVWYNVDVTWDSDQGSDKYFLLTNNTISSTAYGKHTPSVSFPGYTMATQDNPYKDAGKLSASLLGCNAVCTDMIDLECWFDASSWATDEDKDATTGNKVVFDIPSTPGYKQTLSYADKTTTGTTGGKSCVIFNCKVPIRCISEVITAQVVSGDGTKKSEVFRVSVKKYIDVLLEDDSTAQVTVDLLKSLLIYGAYAQEYFNMNPPVAADAGVAFADNPIKNGTYTVAKVKGYIENGITTSDVPNVQIPYGLMYKFYTSDPKPYSSSDENITYYASALILRSQTVVRHYFKLNNGAKMSDYTFTFRGNATTVYEKGGYVCVETEGWSPKSMLVTLNNANYFRVKNNATNSEVIKFQYNPMDYVDQALSTDGYKDDTKLTNVLLSMWWYSINAHKHG